MVARLQFSVSRMAEFRRDAHKHTHTDTHTYTHPFTHSHTHTHTHTHTEREIHTHTVAHVEHSVAFRAKFIGGRSQARLVVFHSVPLY